MPVSAICCPPALQAKGGSGESRVLKLLPVPTFILAKAFFFLRTVVAKVKLQHK